MKTQKTFIALLVVLFATQATLAQGPYSKNYSKTFELTEKTVVKIENRYGDVHIESWNKKQAKIEVVVLVKNKRREKADKVFETVEIIFGQNENEVSATTELNGALSNVDFEINYNVKMPATTDLTLLNKYGSVYADKLLGYTDLTVKYGAFKINTIKSPAEKNSQLFFAYSKGSVQNADNLSVGIKYSSFDLGQVDKLLMVSKYSKINIENVKKLKVESSYDTPFGVGTVDDMEGIAKYSNLEIKQLNTKLELDAKYSDINIVQTSADFSNIKMEIKYGKAKLSISPKASYNLDALLEYGSIHFPESEKIKYIKDDFEERITGTVGENPRAKVFIRSKYANIDL